MSNLSPPFRTQVEKYKKLMEIWLITKSETSRLAYLDRQNNLNQALVQMEFLQLLETPEVDLPISSG